MLLADFAVEFLDFEHDLLVFVIGFNFPAPEIETDDLFSGKAGLVEQIGEKHRHRSVGAYESDDSQLNDFGLLRCLRLSPSR